MKTYTKILIFFKKINVHRSSVSTFSKDRLTYSFIFSYKNKKANLDLNKTLISLYSTLKIIQLLGKQASVLFVGNIDNILFFDIIKKRTGSAFFIQRWIPGVLSNWGILESLVNTQDSSLLKYSFKLRFFRFFYSTFNNKKPNLVIICGTPDENLIASECYSQGIPVISLDHLIKESKPFVSYRVPSNITSFLSSSLLIQLYIGQLFINNSNAKK